jgi:hypothetical protein
MKKAQTRKQNKKLSKAKKSGSGQLFAILDERVKELAKTTITLYGNQQRLAKGFDDLAAAGDMLDEQFAVLSRLVVMQLNKIVEAFNTVTGGMPAGAPRVELISRADVTTLFGAWREFKKRSDFRDHNTAWFMGEDLSKLPPPPKEEKVPDAPQNNLESAEVFGGDYAKSTERDTAVVENQSQNTGENPAT